MGDHFPRQTGCGYRVSQVGTSHQQHHRKYHHLKHYDIVVLFGFGHQYVYAIHEGLSPPLLSDNLSPSSQQSLSSSSSSSAPPPLNRKKGYTTLWQNCQNHDHTTFRRSRRQVNIMEIWPKQGFVYFPSLHLNFVERMREFSSLLSQLLFYHNCQQRDDTTPKCNNVQLFRANAFKLVRVIHRKRREMAKSLNVIRQ